MATLIIDPDLESEVRAQRKATGADRFDEVWDGVYVMAPLANDEHQGIAARLVSVFQFVLGWDSAAKVRAGVNVSDRVADWQFNYRCPDVVVYMPTTTARNLETHWVGGPDFGVEVASPKEEPRQKLAFYAAVNTRELLVVDRYPWSLELFRLVEGELRSVGRATPESPVALASDTLALTFSIRRASPRPLIVVTHRETGQTWTA